MHRVSCKLYDCGTHMPVYLVLPSLQTKASHSTILASDWTSWCSKSVASLDLELQLYQYLHSTYSWQNLTQEKKEEKNKNKI